MTELDEFQEKRFRQWYGDHAKRLGLNPDPDDPEHYYDYRGAYKEGIGPGPDGHWDSRFKTDEHPRLILKGYNTKTGKKIK